MGGDNKCPECADPIQNLRATCPNCGYEYQEGDYTDTDEGSEFLAGAAIDDEGNEIVDSEAGGAPAEDAADDR